MRNLMQLTKETIAGRLSSIKVDNENAGGDHELKEQLNKMNKKAYKMRVVKFVGAFIAFLLAALLSQETIIKVINLMKSSANRDLLSKINDGLVPSGMNSDTIITADFLFPAWNLSLRKPTFFSNILKSKYPDSEQEMSFDRMAAVSASNPVYFNAAKVTYQGKDGEVTNQFIGGSTVSENPAMYAYLYAMELMEVPSDKISLTSIGAVEY